MDHYCYTKLSTPKNKKIKKKTIKDLDLIRKEKRVVEKSGVLSISSCIIKKLFV